MSRMLFHFLLYILALYGFAEIALQVLNAVRSRLKPADGSLHLLLLIKDQEDFIEGIIRNIFMGEIVRRYIPGGRLMVVDMGSKDQTVDILLRLKDEYPDLEVVQERGKRKYLHTLGLGIYFKKRLKT